MKLDNRIGPPLQKDALGLGQDDYRAENLAFCLESTNQKKILLGNIFYPLALQC